MMSEGEGAMPEASRPYMPGYGIQPAEAGKGLLPWDWARERLSEARNYWLASVRPDGRPHVTAVWGLWLDEAFYFSMDQSSRKARNLSLNGACVVCPEGAAEAVIVEGEVEEVKEEGLLERLRAAYNAKYDWDMKGFPFWVARPRVAFGFIEAAEDFAGTATRWRFGE